MKINKQNIKKQIHIVIHPHKTNILSVIFSWSIIFLVVTDICTTILETLILSERVLFVFHAVEIVTVVIFTVEYVLRIWTADMLYRDKNPVHAALKHAFTLMMIVDFIAVAPVYLHFIFAIDPQIFRVLRILRIFRLLKVNSYVKALSHVGDVLRQKALQLLVSTLIIFTLMVVASVSMYAVEHDAQPEVFDNALSGLWWAVTTAATIGYGDIYPVTVAGKVIGAFFSVLNIGLVAVPTGIISAGFIENTPENEKGGKNKKDKKQKIKRYCPYCGENIEE